jgi:hypothetical protein
MPAGSPVNRLPSPGELDQLLANQAEALCRHLLPNGRRVGHEWCCGSLAGEAGGSLGVHLHGDKRGVWADFATGECGGMLDLIQARLCFNLREAMVYAREFLGIGGSNPTLHQPRQSTPTSRLFSQPDSDDLNRWCGPWYGAEPIPGTKAETYLKARDLEFDDPEGRVLRFCGNRARRSPDHKFERHPALLAALCDIRTGTQVGIINTYLKSDGSDRIRDKKGKTVTGRAKDSAIMMSDFIEVTMGLAIAEGLETGIAIFMHQLRPIWSLGSASNLKSFPVLGGIECLTIASDAGQVGESAAKETAERWQEAGRQAVIVTAPTDDWATV